MLKILYAILFTLILMVQYTPIEQISTFLWENNISMVEDLNETNGSTNLLSEPKETKYIHELIIAYFPPVSNDESQIKFRVVNERLQANPYTSEFYKPPNFIV